MEQTNKPVVYVDDIIELEIFSRGNKGDGVGKIGDFVVFVPQAEIRKLYKVKITKVFKNFAIGEILDTIEDKKTDKEAE